MADVSGMMLKPRGIPVSRSIISVIEVEEDHHRSNAKVRGSQHSGRRREVSS